MAVIHSELKGDVKFTNHRIDGDVENTNHTIRGNIQQSLGVMSEWGKIVGDIDDQTDLKNALDGKADVGDIPTVNNGTLTIQRNGTDVATFTANQSGNSTANISVPEEVFMVNVTLTDMTTGTSDKSSEEIYNAVGHDRSVFVKANLGTTLILGTLSWVSMVSGQPTTYYACFTYEDQSNPTYKYCTMTILGNAVTLAFKNGYITGIDSTMVTNALGFTPYSDTNPSNYTSDSALTTTDIDEAIA